MSTILDEKIKEHFTKMCVFKGANKSIFASCSIPSYIRDWFLMRYEDKDGHIDEEFVSGRLYDIVPRREEWLHRLDRMMNYNEEQKFLAKIKVKLNLNTSEISFTLPDFDVNYKDTIIDREVWEKIKTDALASEEEVWGVVTLAHVPYKKNTFKIELRNFALFRPYNINLEYYREARKNFTLEEWLKVLLGAMDYNAEGYPTTEAKLEMLKRLLPFVEKRTNLIELAPKGTGKSYVFSQISKYGWLNSGGVMSRAKLFYDMARKQVGLIGNYDFVVLDEISTIRFTDLEEMQGCLKGFLESGSYAVGVKKGTSDAGMVFMGNIKQSNMDINVNMFKELPELFNDPALLDRIHGFIQGWKIPRMDEKMKMYGWALNSEYFSEIMHELREDSSYYNLVSKMATVNGGDTRDIKAVTKIATGLVKLLFPHWTNEEDVDKDEFVNYCLNPAMEMRKIIKTQLGIMDVEYRDKPFPEFTVKQNN